MVMFRGRRTFSFLFRFGWREFFVLWQRILICFCFVSARRDGPALFDTADWGLIVGCIVMIPIIHLLRHWCVFLAAVYFEEEVVVVVVGLCLAFVAMSL